MASAQADAYSIFRDELCKYWQSMLLLVLLKPENVINPLGSSSTSRGSLDIYEEKSHPDLSIRIKWHQRLTVV